MAIDTRNKRAAVVSLGLWRGRVLPLADGTIDAADRGSLALLYPLEALVAGVETAYVFVRGLL